MTVDVAGPEWRDTLSRWSPQILERVRLRLGAEAPRQLEFRIRPGLWRPAERVSPAAVATRGVADEGELPPAVPAEESRVADSDHSSAARAERPAPDADRGAALERIAGRYLAAIASRRSGSVS